LIAGAAIFSTAVAKEAVRADASAMNQKDQKLVMQLNSAELEKRVDAAQELGERKVQGAVKELQSMLQKDKEYRARIVAGMALVEIGDKSALEAIKKQAENDPVKTARTALKAMATKLEQQS
jgi:HEAT repeat protein